MTAGEQPHEREIEEPADRAERDERDERRQGGNGRAQGCDRCVHTSGGHRRGQLT